MRVKLPEYNRERYWFSGMRLVISSYLSVDEVKLLAEKIFLEKNMIGNTVLEEVFPIDTAKMDQIDGVARDPNLKDLYWYYFTSTN